MATRISVPACLIAFLIAGAAGVAAAQDVLRIAPRDQVVVTVLDAPQYSGKYQVDSDGTFDYAALGQRMKASGMTPTELASALKKVLGETTFRNPQVTVELEQSAHMKVLVTGEVRASGAFAYAGEMHVLEALIKAGSVTENAGDEAIIVHANGSNSPVNEYVDLQALLAGDVKQNFVLRDGDTVIVPKAQTLYIMGYVRNPGPYPVHRGMTVEQALALAGGVTDMGNKNNIRIKRIASGKTKADELKAGHADLVRPGDIIDVKRGIW
jgi:polysaccharide biosynthesis/export protein